jgi:carboxyl-terminal processing protease
MPRFSGRAFRWAALVAALVCAYAMGAASRTGKTGSTANIGAVGTPPEPTLDDAARWLAGRTGLPRGPLERAAIEAMLRRTGDRWARYYTADQFDAVRDTMNGYYSGVGLWLDAVGGDIQVAGVQPGAPAGRAGVRPGDVISSVGGVPARGRTIAEIATALRGRPATTVPVELRRGTHSLRLTLVRAVMGVDDVAVSTGPSGTRMIRVAAFSRGVSRTVRRAVADDHDRGVVLDLRGDPGGLLDEAVETASVFLDGGPVATYERLGGPAERLDAEPGGDTATPLVVLVDGGTASAAEVVAGSLRERGCAVIVGSRTFGKGSVQEPEWLADGSAIELTVGRYRTPSGRSLDGSGIVPDVAVDPDRPPREAEQRALTVLSGLRATLPNKDRG